MDKFQFTPLREGRLKDATGQDTAALISIHAPPRGATICAFVFVLLYSYFNSRPSARGDARCTQLYCEIFISIHAPPRGATIICYLHIYLQVYFNSRPSARGDVGKSS